MTIKTPSTPRTQRFNVLSTTAKTLIQYLNNRGLNTSEIHRSLNFEFNDLESPDSTLPLDIYQKLWDLALTHTQDTQLGLRLALKPYNNEMSLVSHVFFNSENLREGLKHYIRYFALINNSIQVELQTTQQHAILQYLCEQESNYCLQDMEHTMALSVMRIKEHLNPKSSIALDEVHFQHSNTDSALYDKVFQCPVRFNQACSALVFKKHYLDYVFPQKSTHLFQFLSSHLEKLLAKVKKEENFRQ